MSFTIESQFNGRKWQFTKEEIENLSPSRKDGIDLMIESHLRNLYCTFIQEIGIKLQVPQVTIASAMMLCHQFYMRQSHAKNDWQTVATACIFLGCKSEETPRYLNDVVVIAYEMMNKWDPSAPQRIRQREVFDKQKELILVAERLVLSTVAFDLNIQLPYKPLIKALKRLEILPDLGKVAWNFVNDWIRTTLCLQYESQYIAAVSLFLAAKLQKVKLPTQNGKVWWMEFDVTLKLLEEVIQETQRMLGKDKNPPPVAADRRLIKNPLKSSCSSNSISHPIADQGSKQYYASESIPNLSKINNLERVDTYLPCDPSSSGSGSSGVEDGDGVVQPSTTTLHSNPKPQPKIDIDRIRQAMKKRKREMAMNTKKPLHRGIDSGEIDCEAWIESELENGIELRNDKRMFSTLPGVRSQ